LKTPAALQLSFPDSTGQAPPLVYCPFEDCGMPAELQKRGPRFSVVGCHHVRTTPGRNGSGWLAVFDPDENDDD